LAADLDADVRPCRGSALDQGLPRLSLAGLIETDVIPRLLVAHRVQPLPIAEPPVAVPVFDAERIADLALADDAPGLLATAQLLLSTGAAVDALLVDLLAPAARVLGTRWEQDEIDFIDVTMALWRLQMLVHEVAATPGRVAPGARSPTRRALFAVVPGDGHGFGSVVLEEIFRRDGWETVGQREATEAELLADVARDWFDVVALSASIDKSAANVGVLLADLRAASRNPGVALMVGGPVFAADPGLAARIGADATAPDARGALANADRLVAARRGSPIRLAAPG
jgi:methanogenic corrinoid protein MtbC1